GHLEVAVVGGEGCHLAEADPAGAERGPRGTGVDPAEQLQVVDREGDLRAALGDAHPVVVVDVGERRQRGGALGDQVGAGALAQVSGVEAALAGPLAAVVGHVQRAHVTGVVLRVVAAARGERGVEEVTLLGAGRGEEEHRQAGARERAEVPRDLDVGAEDLRAPERDVCVVAAPRGRERGLAGGAAQPHAAVDVLDADRTLGHPALEVRGRRERVAVGHGCTTHAPSGWVRSSSPRTTRSCCATNAATVRAPSAPKWVLSGAPVSGWAWPNRRHDPSSPSQRYSQRVNPVSSITGTPAAAPSARTAAG